MDEEYIKECLKKDVDNLQNIDTSLGEYKLVFKYKLTEMGMFVMAYWEVDPNADRYN